MSKVIDLNKPRYDQSSYEGRAKHFFLVTNPLNILASGAQLDEAKSVVDYFRKTQTMPKGYDEDKLWAAKYLYDSAFHPDTGEKMIWFGRMSAQMPMNMLITGCMITFYRTTPATVFWQWFNQTFNAIVNYTNRSGDADIPVSQLFASYTGACGGALGTALYLNKKAKTMSNPIFARLVPLAAVVAANFINIPMMRSSEILSGTPVFTASGDRVGESTRAAALGISLVLLSRVAMAIPGMTLTPIITNWATERGTFCRFPSAVLPFQLVIVGFCLIFATPLGCALFPQQTSISVGSLEQPLQETMKKKYPKEDKVFFNKGL